MESDKTINNIRNFLKGLWCLLKHTEPPENISFIYNGPKNLLYQHLKNYLNISDIMNAYHYTFESEEPYKEKNDRKTIVYADFKEQVNDIMNAYHCTLEFEEPYKEKNHRKTTILKYKLNLY